MPLMPNCVFSVEISRNGCLDSMITRDLVLLMHRSCLCVKIYNGTFISAIKFDNFD